MNNTGYFTISLDFELYWGVRDIQPLHSYQEHIRNEHIVIPKILELFNKYNIHATWCIVGFLFFKDKNDLLKHLPQELPQYDNKNFSPYEYIQTHPLENIYHFAPDCIRQIKQSPGQEIGTSSF